MKKQDLKKKLIDPKRRAQSNYEKRRSLDNNDNKNNKNNKNNNSNGEDSVEGDDDDDSIWSHGKAGKLLDYFSVSSMNLSDSRGATPQNKTRSSQQKDSNKNKKPSSYHEMIINRWNPPLCYSKKTSVMNKIFNNINSSLSDIHNNSGHNNTRYVDANFPIFQVDGGGSSEDYIVHKLPPTVAPAIATRTFQEIDKMLMARRRPKSSTR